MLGLLLFLHPAMVTSFINFVAGLYLNLEQITALRPKQFRQGNLNKYNT